MGLRMVTFAFSLKMTRTILTGQNKALPLETQNTPRTRGQTRIGLAPRKVSSSGVPSAPAALMLHWGEGPVQGSQLGQLCHFSYHTKNKHTSRTSKRNCQCRSMRLVPKHNPLTVPLAILYRFYCAIFKAIAFTLRSSGEIFWHILKYSSGLCHLNSNLDFLRLSQ